MTAPTTKTKHTPLPWRAEAKFEPYSNAPTIYGGNKQVSVCKEGICFTEEDVFNAQFIIRAVNSHYELLEALKLAAEIQENGLVDFERYGLKEDEEILKLFKSAISKAEGKS